MEILFFLFATVALAGAVGVVILRNPFYCVLSLVTHLIALALLFLLLEAQFVAVAQIIVYAGAVMVLYVFVVAYVGGGDRPAQLWRANAKQRALALAFGAALFVELCVALLGTSLGALDTEGADLGAGYGSPGQIGELLLVRFLLPFELASFLLLVAAVGAVALAGRRHGLDEDDLPVDPRHDLVEYTRSAATGSMAEGVAGYGVTIPLPEPSRGEPDAQTAGEPQADGGGERPVPAGEGAA